MSTAVFRQPSESPRGTLLRRPPQPKAVGSSWGWSDRIGAVRARLGAFRMNYRISPGLYALNNPDANAPVIVSANYKLTFDIVRRDLAGAAAWLVIIDTKGINVWCAAGKGTFSTEEVERRIRMTGVLSRVSHRTIILPQLAAPGVSAPQLARNLGVRTVYGPVRSEDLPAFIASGYRATPAQRRVLFPLADRLALSPIELSPMLKYLPIIFVLSLPAAFISPTTFMRQAAVYAATSFGMAILFPALLPIFPFRSFTLGGAVTGIALAGAIAPSGDALMLSNTLIAAALGGYTALNFTGATVFTSETAVRREMRTAVPLLIVTALAGLITGTIHYVRTLC